MREKRFVGLGLVLVFCFVLAGCSGGLHGNSDEKIIETVESSDFYLPMERVRTLNPVSGTDEDCYHISRLIYEGLYALDEHNVPQPCLAKTASYSADGCTLTVQLCEDVKWSDGEPFTAEDVKFSYDAHKNMAQKGTSLYGEYVQGIQSVKTSGSHQVSFTFQSAEDCVLENLTVPVVPRHGFSKKLSVYEKADRFIPVGTGPYKAVTVDQYNKVVLEPNPYYRGTAAVNTITFFVLPDRVDALNLFKIEAIDYTVMTQVDRDTLLNNVDVKETPFLSNEVEVLGFNCNHLLLKKSAVRQAIAYATDRESILSYAYYGNGQLNDTIYYPSYLGVKSNEDPYAYDTAKAANDLAQSGYRDTDGDGYAEDSAGNRLFLEILVNEDNLFRVSAAQTLAAGLKEAGIASEVKAVSWESYRSALNQGNYDLYIGGFQFRDCSAIRPYLYTGNRSGYTDRKTDQLLDQMLGASEDKKAATFERLQKQLKKTVPYYCLLYKTYGAIASDRLNGTVKPHYSDVYRGVETVKIQRTKVTEPEEEENAGGEAASN